jgi:hypothetical protein
MSWLSCQQICTYRSHAETEVWGLAIAVHSLDFLRRGNNDFSTLGREATEDPLGHENDWFYVIDLKRDWVLPGSEVWCLWKYSVC